MSVEDIVPLATDVAVKALRLAAETRTVDLMNEGMSIPGIRDFHMRCGFLADWLESGRLVLTEAAA